MTYNSAARLGNQIKNARDEIACWPWWMIRATPHMNPLIPCKHCGGSGQVEKFRSKRQWLMAWRKEGK